jgi:3-oxoacyl-[acyl-carrier protein] reductase
VLLEDATLSSTAAPVRSARIIRQGSGVILVFGGYGDPLRDHNLGGLQVAFHAQEALKRNLAAELGPRGIRVVTLQTGGIPESIADPELRAAVTEATVARTMTGRAATPADVGNAAAFAASDWAAAMTATKLNITAGSYVDAA